MKTLMALLILVGTAHADETAPTRGQVTAGMFEVGVAFAGVATVLALKAPKLDRAYHHAEANTSPDPWDRAKYTAFDHRRAVHYRRAAWALGGLSLGLTVWGGLR